MLRDVGIVVVLLFVAFQLFVQAEDREPEFTAADIRVVEAPIAGFTTVRVWETAAAPQFNSQTMVSRSAFRLADLPPNVLPYIPDSPWQFENDIPVGAVVRLEVAEDSDALAARARAFPETTHLLPIEGLQIGYEVYFRAIDEVNRAEASARLYQRLGFGAVLAALGWLGWVGWSRRREMLRLAEMIREP